MDLAVCVENAHKTYGSKKVLDGFSISVPKGIIYGLLGPSGCGKTTLLDCLVGGKNLDSGKLKVLGTRPDLNGVPFLKLGYMLQEIGLAPEFTIKEAINYFGKIFGISTSTIKERFEKLSKILDLPPENKLIRKCSGGEQRRVSFAAALINNPELLILDEPTVGLDPVLREVLWNHLLQLVKHQNTAVIITTHYIEEARQAHKVGFMRHGRLLAEDAPEKLLSFHQANTLEEVFLILSTKQAQANNVNKSGNIPRIKPSEPPIINNAERTFKLKTHRYKKHYCKKSLQELRLNVNRLEALFSKNFIQLSRNISGLLFTFLLPVIAMLALLIAIGDDVKNIDIAIVNDENLPNFCLLQNVKLPTKANNATRCKVDQHLSCKFIEELEDPLVHRIFINKLDDGITELNRGNVWAVLYIPTNFTEAFRERIEMRHRVSEKVLNSSQMIAWVDLSNKLIGNSVKLKLTQKLLKLEKEVSSDCNYVATSADSIVQLKGELYGNKNDKFTVFIIPGMLLTVTFFMSITNTVDTIITDRLGGTWYRSVVAGVSSLEIILTHFITQFLILIIQVLELLILTFLIYKAEYRGSLAEITIILLLGGIAGMSYGFWISVSCRNHSVANFLTTGSFYPLVIISGVIWPLEGMSKCLQYCALSLPIALPTLSLRNVIMKGWNFTHLEVLNGVGVQLLWIILLGTICVFQIKKSR